MNAAAPPAGAAPRWRAARVGGSLAAALEQRGDGSLVLRSTEPLGAFPARLSDRLEHWAEAAPDRTLVAMRDSSGAWQRIGYGAMLERARSAGAALLAAGAGVERPLAILSDNSLEHLALALGAMWAGVPFVPVSPAYSLVSQDFGKLRHLCGTVTPKVFFADAAAYAPALAAVAPPDATIVLGGNASGAVPEVLAGRRVVAFAEWSDIRPGAALDAAHAATGPDTIVKFLFTSGSTKLPKGVVNTQRMLCANQQMLRQCLAFLADEPPVLVDWLPWNHTFGGNHNTGLVLYNGGTLHIDEGKPTPKGIARTIANLHEVAPTVYFNVPKGFEELVAAMEHDTRLRTQLFARCLAFMYAGAGLSQAVWDRLDALAEATVGERIPTVTGLGMTETAPCCTFALVQPVASGEIGLPCPGVEVKLAPNAEGSGKTEVRFRGPNVMPGYHRAPEATAEAFDDEGFYRTGDAVRWVDEADPRRGLAFDGRIAEDFKLSSGTFVSVGPLRARIVAAGAPCVQDAVIAGLNRDAIAALVLPRWDDCRALAGLEAAATPEEVLCAPAVVAFFQRLVDTLWHGGTGSATRVARLHVLREPPSIDRGEVTDKGSINQRAVLAHRAALVEAVYAGTAPGVLRPG
jgi:feruloyl-CoA synthase